MKRRAQHECSEPTACGVVRWLRQHGARGYAAWADAKRAGPALRRKLATSCNCARTFNIRGHDHASAWSGKLPIADLQSFWGVLGCSCWAI